VEHSRHLVAAEIEADQVDPTPILAATMARRSKAVGTYAMPVVAEHFLLVDGASVVAEAMELMRHSAQPADVQHSLADEQMVGLSPRYLLHNFLARKNAVRFAEESFLS